MGSLGVGRIFQVVQKPQLRLPFSDLAFVSSLPEHYLPQSLKENIGRVKWEEYNRREGIEDVPEQPIVVRVPIWRRILKLLKILLPHVGLNVLLLSYIAMGATVFIWLEADHELEGRKAKVKHVFDIYSQIMNETIALTNNQSDQATIVSRMRPLLESLSRAHEYDDKFTDTNQLWTGEQDGMTTRWTFAAATLYALTVITSTARGILCNYRSCCHHCITGSLFLYTETNIYQTSLLWKKDSWCSTPSKDRITLEDLKRFLEVQEHLLRQPYVPYNVHLLRWIEDNVGPQMYAQYMDDVSGGKTPMSPSRLSHKMSSSDPMLFF
nr:hypothetical protein C44E12.3 - Caenorhabditis elegans [Caenorhabditis elegans]